MAMLPFILLISLITINLVEGFTPDSLRHVFISSKLDDETHWSITEKGIKKAIEKYFQQKNPNAPLPSSGSTLNLGIVKLRVKMDISVDDIFRIRYGPDCVLDLWNYQIAMEEIATANGDTDTDPTYKNRADFHFDGEQIAESNANIIKMHQLAKDNAMAGQYKEARKALGHAFHLIQDFYSHSNWVEMGHTESNPGLGNPSNNFGSPLASPSTPTCKPCAQALGECKDNLLVTDQLTTGYFKSALGLGPETDAQGNYVLKPTGVAKCSHGGQLDASAEENPIGGINKDVGDLPGSPHYFLHHQAADVAILNTMEFMLAFRTEIGDDQFENLLGLKQVSSLLDGC